MEKRFIPLIASITAAVSLLIQPTLPSHAEDKGSVEKIEYSSLAGHWYPLNKADLIRELDSCLSAAHERRVDGDIVGIIAPHAGYRYSGRVAAQAYQQIKGQAFDSVIVIGPSHRLYFPGISVYAGEGYETPLGTVPIDKELSERLRSAHQDIFFFPKAHRGEHSVEIHLPFLQKVTRDFTLVAIIMGKQDYATCQVLADALSRAISRPRRVLVIASSDLSHFHPYDKARQIDKKLLSLIQGSDPSAVSRALESGEVEACGGGPIVSAMLYARKVSPLSRITILRYENSGDVSGDKTRVVGYLAAAITAKAEHSSSPVGVDLGFTAREKEQLRSLARESVCCAVKGQPRPKIKQPSEKLDRPYGAFVTLKKHGQLRGCIGTIQAGGPLWQTVVEMAEQAALHDPRFPPVTPDELEALQIEISVLTPLRPVTNTAEIQIGRDGLLLVQGYRSGLLLPQVATEFGWDPITFLEQTCRKAGLPRNAWRNKDVSLYRFSAQVF